MTKYSVKPINTGFTLFFEHLYTKWIFISTFQKTNKQDFSTDVHNLCISVENLEKPL